MNPAIQEAGYKRFESGTDTTIEALLNVELFAMLQASSLIIADLTGLRPNCFLELGYALGSQKKVILTAIIDTQLPFDTHDIPCFFWHPGDKPEKMKMEFVNFMSKNITRGPIVKDTPLIL